MVYSQRRLAGGEAGLPFFASEFSAFEGLAPLPNKKH